MNESQKPGRARYLTILDIIAALAGVAAGAAALDAEKTVTESHLVIRWAISFALGFACFFMMRFGLKNAVTSARSTNLGLRNMWLLSAGIFIVVAIGLVVVSGFVASWALMQALK